MLLKLVERGHPPRGSIPLGATLRARRRGLPCAVGRDPDITRLLAPGEIEELFALEHALRHVDTIIDRALEES